MPANIVWVEKILNPHSCVLTHNEAAQILKKAKSQLTRKRGNAEFLQFIPAQMPNMLEQERLKILELTMLIHKRDTMNDVIELQKELRSISESQSLFEKAVHDGYLNASGQPNSKHLMEIHRELTKGKKTKKSSRDNFATSHSHTSTNSNPTIKSTPSLCMKSEYDDSSSSSEKIDCNINGTERKALAYKRKRRIIESDDEEVPIANELPSTCNTDLMVTNAVTEYHKNLKNANIAFDIEASSEKVSVFATSNGPTPTTPSQPYSQISDEMLNAALSCTNVQSNPVFLQEYANYQLPTPKIKHSISSNNLTSEKKKSTTKVFKIFDDADIIQDKQFCADLVSLRDIEWDARGFFGFRPRHDSTAERSVWNALNSLFDSSDINVMQYRSNVAEFNRLNRREKQRVRHSCVGTTQLPDENPLDDDEVKQLRNICQHDFRKMFKRASVSYKLSSKYHQERRNQKLGHIAHNTIIHEALKYLQMDTAAKRTSRCVISAYKKLSKYQLSFIEKLNIINAAPRQVADMLVMLEDLGLRFSKEELTALHQDCLSLYPKDEDCKFLETADRCKRRIRVN